MTLPASASALSAVTLDRAAHRRRPDRRAAASSPSRPRRAAENRWIVYGTPGRPLSFSWKRKVDDRRSALPLRTARASRSSSRSARNEADHRQRALEVVQGLAREVVLCGAGGRRRSTRSSGATRRRLEHEAGALTVTFLEPIADLDVDRRVSAESARAARRHRSAFRSSACRRPSARPAASPSTSSAPARSPSRQPRGLDPADPGDLGDIVAGRESPSMVAFGFKPLAGSAPRA